MGFDPWTAPSPAKTTQDKQLFLQPDAQTTSCTMTPISIQAGCSKDLDRKRTLGHVYRDSRGLSGCFRGGQTLKWGSKLNNRRILWHRSLRKTKASMLWHSAGRIFVSKSVKDTPRYKSTQVQKTQCQATETTHRSEKKTFNSPIHLRVKGRLGKVGRRMSSVCTFCVTVQQPPAGCHYMWLTCSSDQFRKKKNWILKQRSPFKSTLAARIRPQLYGDCGKEISF